MQLGDSSSSPIPVRLIIFRNTIYNDLNAYSNQTGEFTCSVPGVYEFVFFLTSSRSVGTVTLRRNSAVVLSSVASQQSPGRLTYSGQTVLQLNPGDSIRLEASLGSNGLSTDSYFNGHLLFTS